MKNIVTMENIQRVISSLKCYLKEGSVIGIITYDIDYDPFLGHEKRCVQVDSGALFERVSLWQPECIQLYFAEPRKIINANLPITTPRRNGANFYEVKFKPQQKKILIVETLLYGKSVKEKYHRKVVEILY